LASPDNRHKGSDCMTRPSYDPDWRQRYAHKLRSADDALHVVRSGHHIFVGSGAGVPRGAPGDGPLKTRVAEAL